MLKIKLALTRENYCKCYAFFLALLLIFISPQLFASEEKISGSLIPRAMIMGNPEKQSAQISPDGTMYAYIASDKKGVLNVWIQDIEKKNNPRMVTRDNHRGIHSYGWAEDSHHILYLQDTDGDENWHLYSVDLNHNLIRDLTPFQGGRVQDLMVNHNHPQQILVGLNIRNPQVFDMHRVDLLTGAIHLDTQNPGNVTNWLADANFQIRAAMTANNDDGSTALLVRDKTTDPWRKIISWPFGENGSLITFSKDGQRLIITSTLNSNTSRLLEIDPKDGKILKVFANDPKSDIANVLFNENTKVIEAVQFNYLKPEWKIIDDRIAKDFKTLNEEQKGVFTVENRDTKDQLWIVGIYSDVSPISYYLYNRLTHKLTLLFHARPNLLKYRLAAMQPLLIPTQDGLEMVAYLTLPHTDNKPFPLVLNVHGGPWVRDSWGYHAEAQWLANRGYAVLQVNFRGSEGFGKNFLNAGNGQWGTRMQQDLTDAVQWAIKNGIADPKRVCIYGGSYGGYATLAGLTFTPKLYACGIDVVGPSNLQTLVASIPSYWKTQKKEILLRIGDVEKDHSFNQKISPLFHVDQIRAPLLIAQGANDPRVNISQAETILKAMHNKKLPVKLVIYSDEGHGFARPENRLDFYGRMEEFLAQYLGGQREPWKKVPGSTAQIK